MGVSLAVPLGVVLGLGTPLPMGAGLRAGARSCEKAEQRVAHAENAKDKLLEKEGKNTKIIQPSLFTLGRLFNLLYADY
jgi:hypothetical protein